MKKSAIIKIVSIVLVLCTLISVFIIPTSAATVNSSNSFNTYFPLEKLLLRHNATDSNGNYLIDNFYVSNLSNYYIDRTDNVFIRYSNLLSSKGYNLASFQSAVANVELAKGDTVTFDLNIYSPWCDGMGLFLYDLAGNVIDVFWFNRSEPVFTNNDYVRTFSGEPEAYSNLVYCHLYSLQEQFISDGTDIYKIQIQIVHSSVNQVRNIWMCYDDCNFTVDKAVDDTDTGFVSILGKILGFLTGVSVTLDKFSLDITSKISNAVKPLMNSVVNAINNGAHTVPEVVKALLTDTRDGIINFPSNVKTFFTSLGDRIGGFFSGIGENISNYFQNTFLGKVLRITNKTKEFIAVAGNDVQYAALDEAGESTEEAAPDDWDMAPRPSFYVDVDYYNSLYPDLVGG